ncbi:MAG TPA: right-handed parallel beta-helix repeat-containing protein, partial [Polyangiaceae bacterium]|nr:right-handed parallel beta-helix repeat-containing protein [Polyangiaceae bacterium]
DYWTLSGFEVANASDNCVAISGSHNVIDNLSIHGCGDTGLQITVGTGQVADNTRGADNLIVNTDSYENLDVATGGENADGFAAKLRIGPGNVFRGCRAFNNADDGWDFFAADDVVQIDACWAFANGKGVAGDNPAGDGNGFKLGGKPTGAGEGGAVHLVKNSFAFENLTCGFTRNSNPDVPELTDCGAKDNATDYCQTLSRTGEVSMSMTAAAARAVKRAADGSLPPMK